MKTFYIVLFVLVFIISGCSQPVPKPKAMLRLDYPEASYTSLKNECPFVFDKNLEAVLKTSQACQLVLEYPSMKASVHLTYRNVTNNLDSLLRDAQKLTYEHVIKADNISEQPFINNEAKVYGMLYEVGGNAASQSQFYVTDSVDHFLTGALYFYTKPNYDSILPAAHYLKKDIRTIMETLKWENTKK